MSDMDGAASPDGQAQVGGQPFNVGDIVRLDNHYLGRIVSFGEEFPPWGRVVRCEPLVTHPDTPQPPGTRPYGGSDGPLVEWESKLSPAHPGDIGAHLRWPDGRTSGPGYVNVGPNWKPGLSTVRRADTITAAALDFPAPAWTITHVSSAITLATCPVTGWAGMPTRARPGWVITPRAWMHAGGWSCTRAWPVR